MSKRSEGIHYLPEIARIVLINMESADEISCPDEGCSHSADTSVSAISP